MGNIGEHPLAPSLEWQNRLWPEPRSSLGDLEQGWTSASALAEARSPLLAELLDHQTQFQRGVDPRTQASYLIAYLSNLLSVAVAVPFLRSSIVADFSPASFAYRFDDYSTEFQGRAVTMKRPLARFLTDSVWAHESDRIDWPSAALLSGGELRDRFRVTLEGHFAPLIATLEQLTRLSAAAQWRLVSDSVSAVFLEVGRRLGREESAKADAMAILKVPGSPLNNAQLHYFDLSIALGDGPEAQILSRSFRSRGGCCRYYLTEGGHLCTTCVLEKPAERDRRLREAVRRRFAKLAEA